MLPTLATLLIGVGAPPSYYHTLHVSKDSSGYARSTTVKVFTQGTRRLLWKRSFQDEPAVFWSPDKRALAILDLDFNLTTWRAGERVVRRNVAFKEGFGEPPAYEDRHRWSLDNERVSLLVPPTQGDMILDQGWLMVVNVRTGRKEVLDAAKRAEWVDGKTIQYWGERVEIGDSGEATWTKFGPISKKIGF
jgi:hypothetical protein